MKCNLNLVEIHASNGINSLKHLRIVQEWGHLCKNEHHNSLKKWKKLYMLGGAHRGKRTGDAEDDNLSFSVRKKEIKKFRPKN